MTMTNAAAARSDASDQTWARVRSHPLTAIVLLAAAIRLPLAFWPNFDHPDEIFQYLEPAWRMLGHDGIVSWEWREGMRSWLLPGLMTGPMALGDWLVPGGMGAFVLPRLVAALASLSIVISAWAFGARVSQAHAVVAGLVAAVWFELVYFAPHTLGEPLATAVMLPAALLITRAAPSRRDLLGGGALLALAVLFRFQYAPAAATLAIGACWQDRSRILPIMAGGIAMMAVSAVVDAAHGTIPFSWLVANVRQNLLQDRASYFGVMPANAYINCFWLMWSIALVPLLLAVFAGWRHAPVLLWAALVNLAFHSLIGHKEYRFIFLSVALLVIVAALGSADWMLALRTQVLEPSACGAADRRRLDRRFRRARRLGPDAGVLEPGNRRDKTGVGAQGRPSDVRPGALRPAIRCDAGKRASHRQNAPVRPLFGGPADRRSSGGGRVHRVGGLQSYPRGSFGGKAIARQFCPARMRDRRRFRGMHLCAGRRLCRRCSVVILNQRRAGTHQFVIDALTRG